MRLFICLFLMLLLGGCHNSAPQPQVYQESRRAMGSVATMMAFTSDADLAKAAFAAAFAEVERLEGEFSLYRSSSKMVEVNREAPLRPVSIDPEFVLVIERALYVGDLSNGAFDISFAAMAPLWKFPGPGIPGQPPTAEAIAGLKPLVDYRQIKLDRTAGTIALRPGMALGLGGVVKGYAADRAVEVMREKGLDNCMAYLGGDIKSLGRKGDQPWVIGVQDPRGDVYFATIDLKDEAIVSSGDYERYYELDGRRYHHIIDPRTGYPSEGLRHVTVMGPETMLADALATAVMVLGPREGLALIEKLAGYEALLVDHRNILHITNGLKDRVRVLRQPTP